MSNKPIKAPSFAKLAGCFFAHVNAWVVFNAYVIAQVMALCVIIFRYYNWLLANHKSKHYPLCPAMIAGDPLPVVLVVFNCRGAAVKVATISDQIGAGFKQCCFSGLYRWVVRGAVINPCSKCNKNQGYKYKSHNVTPLFNQRIVA